MGAKASVGRHCDGLKKSRARAIILFLSDPILLMISFRSNPSRLFSFPSNPSQLISFRSNPFHDLFQIQSFLNKINAFQLRGLRSILRLEPTFVNRRNTNEFVLRTASEKAGQEVKLFSELLLNKRVALADTF